MKKSTRLISMLLAVLMTVSCFTAFAVFTSSAADEPQKVYFLYPSDGRWGDPSTITVSKKGLANVYCYAYSIYGNTSPFKSPSWEARSTACKDEGMKDGCRVFSFDLSDYGHIDDNADYGIIFSTKNGGGTGYQTTDVTMSSECIGDYIRVIDGTRQNATDSTKKDHYAEWVNHPEDYGVKANISSLGELLDGKWPKYQPRAQQLSNALKNYLFNPINIPYFDLSHNTKLCQGLGVTALDVYKQYMNDNAEIINNGKEVDFEVKSGKTSTFYKGIEYTTVDEKGKEVVTTIPAPSYVMSVLGLKESDINPTTEPVETTTEPVPTTTTPVTEPVVTTAPITDPVETTVHVTDPVETTVPASEDHVYNLAGTPASLFGGAEWTADNAATDMTKNDDGTYSYVMSDVPETKDIQFKVLTDHSWDNPSYGAAGGNFVFSTNGDGDVTVTFNPETGEITVTGDTVYFDTELVIDNMFAVGNGEGTWLNGLSWGDAFESEANIMTKVADGIYEITFEDVDAFDNWQLKFAANGGWTSNWGNAKPEKDPETGEDIPVPSPMNETVDAVYDGGNIIVTVDEDGSTVKAQLDLREFDFATRTGAKYTITVTPPATDEHVYNLAGTPASLFGGAEWTADNAATDMTKNDDGTYSFVMTDVPETKDIQFKVLTDHSWDNPSYGAAGGNFVFSTNGDGDVTVTFNPETGEITVTGDKVYFDTELVIDNMFAVGNGEGTWLNGLSWGDAFESEANIMTKVADGIYEITFEDVDAFDNWQLKFAANGGWTSNWGNAKPEKDPETGEDIPVPSPMNETVDAVYDGGNIIVTVDEDGSTVKAQLDLREFDFATRTGAKYTITVTPPEKETYKYGDVDGDGDIDINDATMIQKAGVELVTLEGAFAEAADVNGDGRISVLDATAVQKYIAKYETGCFKAGEEFTVD